MKFIKITIILLIATVVFGIFFIQIKNKEKIQENIDTNTNIQENGIQNRTIFRTNTDILSTSTNNTITDNESESVISEELIVNTEYTESVEELENIKIKKLLFDWEITKDSELLNQAVILSKSTDNETILESWRSFMSKNSADLIKIIYKSNNIEETKKDIYSIFEWYIELSGEFETLSNTKKQEILKQYNQLK